VLTGAVVIEEFSEFRVDPEILEDVERAVLSIGALTEVEVGDDQLELPTHPARK
jgi:hypothetical protein